MGLHPNCKSVTELDLEKQFTFFPFQAGVGCRYPALLHPFLLSLSCSLLPVLQHTHTYVHLHLYMR